MIGVNVMIICGYMIGCYVFIVVGAVVTRDVPDYALIVGVPGALAGWMCECGVRLAVPVAGDAPDTPCAECCTMYRLHIGVLHRA